MKFSKISFNKHEPGSEETWLCRSRKLWRCSFWDALEPGGLPKGSEASVAIDEGDLVDVPECKELFSHKQQKALAGYL